MSNQETAPLPEIVLDLSRLLSRVGHPTPTGVDRVEMAYARGLMRVAPDRLHFAAVHPIGIYGRLPKAKALRFLDLLEARWAHCQETSPWEARRFAAAAMAALLPVGRRPPLPASGRIFIKASHSGLTQPRLIRSILARERARLVCLLHDLIPIQYPEYARPEGAAQHRIRIQTIVDQAHGVICNSHATLQSLAPWLADAARTPETAVAHLGTHLHDLPERAAPGAGRPYFVCVGTIEPRKNHLLLLNIWRRMSEEHGAGAIPRLLLIGRRGWENEQVVDMLDRCPALRGCVEEHGRLTDREIAPLLAGARALLMPSFAEGYGMPVTEALAAGVPVLCSDLPALREAGQGVPEYLDALDGPGWRRAIDDLAGTQSIIHRRQRAQLAQWRGPTWDEHIAIVIEMLHRLTA